MIDLKLLDSAIILTNNILQLKLINGEIFLYKNANYIANNLLNGSQWTTHIKEWSVAIIQRLESILSRVSEMIMENNYCVISGKLLKKSGNKLVTQLQVCLFV